MVALATFNNNGKFYDHSFLLKPLQIYLLKPPIKLSTEENENNFEGD